MKSAGRIITTLLAVTVLSLPLLASPGPGGVALAGSLENLERERALLLEVFLDPAITPQERAARVALSQQRLLDLERVALRDDSLLARNTPTVRRAFENYDLTFLVHAAGERGVPLIDQWLDQIGVSTQALMAARAGRR